MLTKHEYLARNPTLHHSHAPAIAPRDLRFPWLTGKYPTRLQRPQLQSDAKDNEQGPRDGIHAAQAWPGTQPECNQKAQQLAIECKANLC